MSRALLFLFLNFAEAKSVITPTTQVTTTTTAPARKPLIDTIDDELVKARKNIKGALGNLEDEGNKASKKIQKQFHDDKEENAEKGDTEK